MDKKTIDANDWFVPGPAYDQTQRPLLFEQYKLYVGTASDVSERRGKAHTLMLTVNTSLVTVYGLLLGKDAALSTVRGPWRWMLPLVGLLVVLTWFYLVRSYRALNSAKFRVIAEMEKRLAMRMFDLEWEYLQRRAGSLYSPLSHIEQYVPLAFGALYLALLIWSVIPFV